MSPRKEGGRTQPLKPADDFVLLLHSCVSQVHRVGNGTGCGPMKGFRKECCQSKLADTCSRIAGRSEGDILQHPFLLSPRKPTLWGMKLVRTTLRKGPLENTVFLVSGQPGYSNAIFQMTLPSDRDAQHNQCHLTTAEASPPPHPAYKTHIHT